MVDRIASFKEVMGNYPTGVTVITAYDEQNNPIGLTVNSFASVSLDPMLILWSIDKRSASYESILKTDKFAVNILAEDQSDLCILFSSKVADRFSQCKWTKSDLNLPLLTDSLAVMQCKTFKQVDAGDHTILIGEVIDIQKTGKEPLLYHRRKFGPIPETFHS